MTNHVLSDLRRAAVALLETKFQRVMVQRNPILTAQQLPCVLVYVDGRRSEQLGWSPVSFEHSVHLAVCVCVQANRNGEDLAEAMLYEVEQLIAAHPDLQRPDQWGWLKPATLQIEQANSGEVDTLYYQQLYTVSYVQEYADDP